MTDDTYTHRPGAVEGGDDSDAREDPESEKPTAVGESGERLSRREPGEPVERADQEFGWRGWVLVGVIVVCFLVIPGVILALPPLAPFRFAYLVLPLIPAVILGAVAVWSAQRT